MVHEVFSKKLDTGLRRYDGRGVWYRYPSIVTPMKIGVQVFVVHETFLKRLDTGAGTGVVGR